jgi:hypothetical protein
MAKNYTLEKSRLTGGWTWKCKDGSGSGGPSQNKADAKRDAEAKCGTGFALVPPEFDAEFTRGYLTKFTAFNLDGERITFSAGEIAEEAFHFFFGLEGTGPSSLTPAEKAITILKIWGIYRGGATEPQIRKLHHLEKDQFTMLTGRQVEGLSIQIDDNGTIRWKFAEKSSIVNRRR